MKASLFFALSFLVVLSFQATVPIQEFEALQEFYNTFGGQYWIHNQNWNDYNKLCSSDNWYGVACYVVEPHNHIYIINLPANNLTGVFNNFDMWGNWTLLTYLFMQQNNITGSIPPSFYNESPRQQVMLSFNNITGILSESIGVWNQTLEVFEGQSNLFSGNLPSNFFLMPRLQRLLLGNNSLSGSLPINTATNLNLEFLDVSQNNLQGDLPTMLWNLTSMNILLMSSKTVKRKGYFGGKISPNIINMKNLNKIDLSNNNLRGSIPDEICELASLTEVAFTNNKLDGTIPTEIGKLTLLKQLSFGLNTLSGTIPNGIWNCTYLELLDFGLNKLNGTIPSLIGNLVKLNTLNLKGMPASNRKNQKFSGSLPNQLFTLSQLRFLFLSFNFFEGSIPSTIGNMTSLATFNLEKNVMNGSLPEEIYSLPLMSSFIIYENKFSGPLSSKIGQWKKLRDFDIHGNKFQGLLPSFFNISSNPWPEMNPLLSNPFSCPVPKNATRFLGATCKATFILEAIPNIVFRERYFSVTLTSNWFPVVPNMTCVVGTSPNQLVAEVLVPDNKAIICYVPPSNLKGFQPINVLIENIEITTTSTKQVLMYGTPKITNVIPSTWREQGGDSNEFITVIGEDFVNTGVITSWYGTKRSRCVYVNDTAVTCQIPRQTPGVYKFFVANDDQENFGAPLLFTFYEWCEGFPACYGPEHGVCINVTGIYPYCQCNSPGFNNDIYCLDCMTGFYGPNCDPCSDCGFHGECKSGYNSDGACDCYFLYKGYSCDIEMLNYVGLLFGGLVFLMVLITMLVKCFKKEKRIVKDEPLSEFREAMREKR